MFLVFHQLGCVMGSKHSILMAGFFLGGLISLTAQVPGRSSAQIVEGRLPIVFEPAPLGRDSSIAMIGRAAGGIVGFRSAAINIYTGKDFGGLEISFDGAQRTAPKGVDLEQSQTNYLLGSNPSAMAYPYFELCQGRLFRFVQRS
ncbi:MAG: hypothetical protein ABR898_09130 [Terracidiphilus sp.]